MRWENGDNSRILVLDIDKSVKTRGIWRRPSQWILYVITKALNNFRVYIVMSRHVRRTPECLDTRVSITPGVTRCKCYKCDTSHGHQGVTCHRRPDPTQICRKANFPLANIYSVREIMNQEDKYLPRVSQGCYKLCLLSNIHNCSLLPLPYLTGRGFIRSGN